MSILSIQSHVAYGHVGNAAAVFPLQRLGFEVWPVHTVQFSNHPGYGAWQGEVFAAAHIGAVIDGIAARGALAACEAVLSGYLGSAGVGATVAGAVDRVRHANPDALYVCDPVMGDTGPGLYVRDGIPAFLRAQAVPRANVLTPNVFELEYLAQTAVSGREAAIAAAQGLLKQGPSVVLVTSLRSGETPAEAIDMLAVAANGAWQVRTPFLPLSPPVNGAGDALAALFLAHYLKTREAAPALANAAAAIFAVIAATHAAGSRELRLIDAQEAMINPSRRFAAEKIA